MPRRDVDDDDTVDIVVRVVRSGGFAGMRKEWTAEPAHDQASVWITLIEDCPWDAASHTPRPDGADRFVWVIEATCQRDERSVRLSDDEMHGPWRALVDAVREFAAPAKR